MGAVAIARSFDQGIALVEYFILASGQDLFEFVLGEIDAVEAGGFDHRRRSFALASPGVKV